MFFDEEDFFLAAPAFELFFASDCVADVGEGFEVDEFGGVVGLGEAGDEFLLVLRYAALEMVGDADIENARSAGHDVNMEDHWWGILTGIGEVENGERELRGFGVSGVC